MDEQGQRVNRLLREYGKQKRARQGLEKKIKDINFELRFPPTLKAIQYGGTPTGRGGYRKSPVERFESWKERLYGRIDYIKEQCKDVDEQTRKIDTMLDSLPPTDRALLWGFYVDRLNMGTIAEQQGRGVVYCTSRLVNLLSRILPPLLANIKHRMTRNGGGGCNHGHRPPTYTQPPGVVGTTERGNGAGLRTPKMVCV